MQSAPVSPLVTALLPGAARPGRLCLEPEELYGPAASETIGKLLERWLAHQAATPFELLHRPELAARLDGTGTDLQQAIQKLAVPTALAGGSSVHEIVRQLQRLTDRAIARLNRQARTHPEADLEPSSLIDLSLALTDTPDARLRLGCAVARRMAGAENSAGKLKVLLDLAAAAPADGGAPLLADVLEQPVRELLRSPAATREFYGDKPPLGHVITADLALAHQAVFKAVSRVQPRLAEVCPPLPPELVQLSEAFQRGCFPSARRDLSRRILEGFAGRKRLQPDSPVEEIKMLRLLATAMTAVAGPLMPEEDVRNAIVARSTTLLEPGFLGALVGARCDPFVEMERLALLLANVAGAANRSRGVRLLEETIASRRLARAMSESRDAAAAYARLARVRERIAWAADGVASAEGLLAKIDELALIRSP